MTHLNPIIFILFLLSGIVIPQLARASLYLDDIQKPTLIPMQIYHDPNSIETKESILSRQAAFRQHEQRTYLFHQGAFWLRFTLEQKADQDLRFRIVHTYAYTDQISLYIQRDEKLVLLGEQGDQLIADSSDLGRLPQFIISPKKGRHVYFIRLKTNGPAHLSFYLHQDESFIITQRDDTLWVGFLFGCVMVMMAYNLFLGIRLGHSTFFVYVGYIFGFLLVQAIFTGMLQSFLPAGAPRVMVLNQGLIVAAEFTGVCGSLFTIAFLSMKKYLPKIYRFMIYLFPLSFANIVLAFFSVDLATYCVLLTNGAYTSLILLAALVSCRKRFRPAYFFTAAWIMILFGSFVTMGRIYGFAPDNSFTTWSQFCGGILEMVLLSLAMGDKMSYSEQKAHRILKDKEALLAQIHIEQAIAHEREISEQTQRLEVDLRFQLAASIAHRLNNPLNYIQINLEVMLRELFALEKTLEKMLPTEEHDPEVKETRELLQSRFKGIKDPLTHIQEGLDRSSDSVREMRALSGLDGNALSQFQLKDFRALVKQRLFEQKNQNQDTSIFFEEDSSDCLIIGNPYTYMSIVDLLLTIAIQSGKGKISLVISAEGQHNFYIDLRAEFQWDKAVQRGMERCLQNILKASPLTATLHWEQQRCHCHMSARLQHSSTAA